MHTKDDIDKLAADFEGIGQGGEQSEGIEFWFTEY
jgi:hypothetical protein